MSVSLRSDYRLHNREMRLRTPQNSSYRLRSNSSTGRIDSFQNLRASSKNEIPEQKYSLVKQLGIQLRNSTFNTAISFGITLMTAILSGAAMGVGTGFTCGVLALLGSVFLNRKLNRYFTDSLKMSHSALARIVRGSFLTVATLVGGAGAGGVYLYPDHVQHRSDVEILGLKTYPKSIKPQDWQKVAESDSRLSPMELADLKSNKPRLSLETPFGKINYIRAGNPDGKTILLMPGFPDQIYSFHLLIQDLAAMGFDVVAIDPPGKGWSTFKDDYGFTYPEQTEFWKMMIQKLGLKNVTGVGYSAGMTELFQTMCTSGNSLDIPKFVSLCGEAYSVLPEKTPDDFIEQLTAGNYFTGPVFVRAFTQLPFLGVKDSFPDNFSKPLRPDQQYIPVEYNKAWNQQGSFFLPEEVAAGIFNSWHAPLVIQANAETFCAKQASSLVHLNGKQALVITANQDRTLINEKDRDPTALGNRLADKLKEVTGKPVTRVQVNSGHEAPLEVHKEVANAIADFVNQ